MQQAEPDQQDTLQAAIRSMAPSSLFARNNFISVILMSALPAIAGSVTSILAASFVVWAVLTRFVMRWPLGLHRGEARLLAPFLVFPLVMAATALMGQGPNPAPFEFLWLAPYAGLPLLALRLARSPEIDYPSTYALGAALGSMIALALAFVQFSLFDVRPEGGAGNALIFALLALLLGALAAVNLHHKSHALRLLAAVGLATGVLASVISTSRTMWITMVAVLPFVMFQVRRRMRLNIPRVTLMLAAALLHLILLVQVPNILSRSDALFHEYEALSNADTNGSLGLRLQMWGAGWAALQDAPWVGHGFQNRMASLTSHLTAENVSMFSSFTHPHNAYLSAGLDGGVLGLCAFLLLLVWPVVIAHQTWRLTGDSRLFMMGATVTLGFALSGLTNLLYNHDIIDAFFIFHSALIAGDAIARRRTAGLNGFETPAERGAGVHLAG